MVGKSMVLWGLLAAPMARADEPLTCDLLMGMVGAVPLDNIVAAVESERRLAKGLLQCLEKRDAPQPLVAAVKRRLGEDDTGARVASIVVDTKGTGWPEEVGRDLADWIRLMVPGEAAIAFMVEDTEEGTPWWMVEFQDRVVAAVLGRLPEGSNAAESPEVLGPNALGLVDESRRVKTEFMLARLGFRRSVLVRFGPGAQDGAGVARVVVHELGSDERLERTLNLTRVEDGGAEVVASSTVDPDPAVPGRQVEVTLRLTRGSTGQPFRGLVVTFDGGTGEVSTTEETFGSYTADIQVPEDLIGVWLLDWKASDASAGAWSGVIPVELAGGAVGVGVSSPPSGRGGSARRRRGNAMVSAGVPTFLAGAALTVVGGVWIAQLRNAEFDVTRDTYGAGAQAMLGSGIGLMGVGAGLTVGGGIFMTGDRQGMGAAIAWRL